MTYGGSVVYPTKKSYFTQVQDTTYNTGTWNDGANGFQLKKVNNGNHNGLMTALIAAPSTPYSMVARLVWNGFNLNNGSVFSDPGPAEASTGMCFANGTATSSKVKLFRWGNLNGSTEVSGTPVNLYGIIAGDQFSAYTTEIGNGSGEQHCPPMAGTGGIWMKLRDDGTNCIYFCSADGITWQQFYSETRTTYFTATYAGVYVNPYGSDCNVVVSSFQIINS